MTVYDMRKILGPLFMYTNMSLLTLSAAAEQQRPLIVCVFIFQKEITANDTLLGGPDNRTFSRHTLYD